jgi:hypothetical protein
LTTCLSKLRARASSLGIKTGHLPPARHVSKHTTHSLASVAPMVPSIPVLDKNCKVDPSLHSFLSSYYPISHFPTRPCILSQNIRSYSANVDSLTELLGRCTNATIIAIQEVWNGQHIIQIPVYQPLIYRCRKKKNRGGVGFLVKQGLKVQIHQSPFIEGKFETLTITVKFNGKDTRICNIYKPPGGTNTDFLNYCKRLKFPCEFVNIVLGDMNIDILKLANYDVKLHFAQLKLGPLIDIPTRCNKHSSTLIDHVYASSKKLTGFVLETDISDHYTGRRSGWLSV